MKSILLLSTLAVFSTIQAKATSHLV